MFVRRPGNSFVRSPENSFVRRPDILPAVPTLLFVRRPDTFVCPPSWKTLLSVVLGLRAETTLAQTGVYHASVRNAVSLWVAVVDLSFVCL